MGHRSRQLPPGPPRSRGRSSGALVALMLLLAAPVAGSLPGGVGRADDLPPPPAAASVTAAAPAANTATTATTTATFKGTETCVRCHRSEQGEWTGPATTLHWREDAHSRAHLALAPTHERTAAIERVLGIEARRTRACIACHSHAPAEPAVTAETPLLHAGISCETCHGAASAYLEPHAAKEWRFLPTEEKSAFGMHDLRSPAVKAANCAACHVGDIGSGRLVTHGMYAAGHPPLRPFEVESFSTALGPHWHRIDAKPETVRAEAAAAGYRTEAAGPIDRSLIEGLGVLRQSVRLAADLAAVAEGETPQVSWPELSLHDCRACHHELVLPSERQALGYRHHVPGRPTLPRWPLGLAGAALRSTPEKPPVDDLLAPLLAEFDAVPFGTPRRVVVAAVGPLKGIDAAIARLAPGRAPGDEAGDRAAIEALAAAGATADDVDAARVVAAALLPALATSPAWGADERRAACDRIAAILGLEPAGMPPGSHRPAPTAAPDIRAVRAAFILPAPTSAR